ncbi:hypothetical protein S83_053026, partial [Arachis hypogaea]
LPFTKKVGMSNETLENYAYASFCALKQKMAMGPFEDEAGPSQMRTIQPQIPDLNFPAPREDEAGSSQMLTMPATKRKAVHQAYQSGGKRFKVSEGTANFSKGKGIIVIED